MRRQTNNNTLYQQNIRRHGFFFQNELCDNELFTCS